MRTREKVTITRSEHRLMNGTTQRAHTLIFTNGSEYGSGWGVQSIIHTIVKVARLYSKGVASECGVSGSTKLVVGESDLPEADHELIRSLFHLKTYDQISEHTINEG